MSHSSLRRRTLLKSGLAISLLISSLIIGVTVMMGFFGGTQEHNATRQRGPTLKLPSPRLEGPLSVEQALLRRRSRREYRNEKLSIAEVSQLLWAAQGVTAPQLWTGLRTAPSAGGLYPLEVYVVVREGGVEEIKAGIYHYDPHKHELSLVVEGDYSRALMSACVDQEWVGSAAFNIVFTAVVNRTRVKYGDRALQYVFQESGHAAQNVYLQAEALGLGCVVVGAFHEGEVRKILKASQDELPVYVMPVGKPA